MEIVEEGIKLSRHRAGQRIVSGGTGGGRPDAGAGGICRDEQQIRFKVACRFECDLPVLIHDPATRRGIFTGSRRSRSATRSSMARPRIFLSAWTRARKTRSCPSPTTAAGCRNRRRKTTGWVCGSWHLPLPAMIGGVFQARRGEQRRHPRDVRDPRGTSNRKNFTVNKAKEKIFLVDDHPLVREWLAQPDPSAARPDGVRRIRRRAGGVAGNRRDPARERGDCGYFAEETRFRELN